MGIQFGLCSFLLLINMKVISLYNFKGTVPKVMCKIDKKIESIFFEYNTRKEITHRKRLPISRKPFLLLCALLPRSVGGTSDPRNALEQRTGQSQKLGVN